MHVWLDIETTGLDPHSGKVLEVGMIVTDNKFEVQEEFCIVIACDLADLEDMPSKVRRMHESSGLLKAVRKSQFTVEAAERELVGFLRSTRLIRPDLAGNSVHFDRKWLEVHMPTLIGKFNYRHFDATSIEGFFRTSMPRDSFNPPDRSSVHRTIEDLLDTINVLKYIQESFSWM